MNRIRHPMYLFSGRRLTCDFEHNVVAPLYQSATGLPRPRKVDHRMLVGMVEDEPGQAQPNEEFHGFFLYYLDFHHSNQSRLINGSEMRCSIRWIPMWICSTIASLMCIAIHLILLIIFFLFSSKYFSTIYFNILCAITGCPFFFSHPRSHSLASLIEHLPSLMLPPLAEQLPFPPPHSQRQPANPIVACYPSRWCHNLSRIHLNRSFARLEEDRSETGPWTSCGQRQYPG